MNEVSPKAAALPLCVEWVANGCERKKEGAASHEQRVDRGKVDVNNFASLTFA